MEGFTEILDRENRSVFKMFLSVIGSVLLIDFVIFICNKYVNKFPYLINIVVILLIIVTCSLIIIKYFSKYSYTLSEQELIFHRIVGKRAFEILRLDLDNLLYIKPYNKEDIKKPIHKILFSNEYENAYIGKFSQNRTYQYLVFKPSKKMVKLINKNINKRSE